MSSKKNPAPAESETKEYTVWCRGSDGRGTIWIESVEATSPDAAKEAGRARCMEDWGEDDPAEVQVLGLAEGGVHILEWDDAACLVTNEPSGVGCG